MSIGEDGPVRHAAECAIARHESHYRGLDASSEADDREAIHCSAAS